MIVGFDATHCGIFDGSRGGVHLYIEQTLKNLLAIDPELELRLFFSLPHPRHKPSIRAFIEELASTRVRYARSPVPERWLYPAGIPVEAFLGRIDVFHGPYHLLARSLAPGVLTVHDLAFLRDRGEEYAQQAAGDGDRGRYAIRRRAMTEMANRLHKGIGHAEKVIAVSQATANDLSAMTLLPSGNIVVVPNGLRPDIQHVDDDGALSKVRHRYGLGPRPFVYIGVLDPNKNLERLIRGFAQYRRSGGSIDLAIVGRSDWYGPVLQSLAAELGIENAVTFTGYVATAELSAFYTMATSILMPSPLEGFGLPALEAMSVGTPVIAANARALPEIVGDCGMLVDPENIEAFAEAFRTMEANPQLRKRLSYAGKIRADRFSWESAARVTLDVYETAIRARHTRRN